MGTNSYYGATASRTSRTHIASPRLRGVVVDDNPEIVLIVAELLEIAGNIDVVATASNGVEALNIVRMLDPDLVLTDINMPRMDGLTAALEIRRLSSDVKILIMSSDDNLDIGLAAKDCGADGFIAKDRLASDLEFHLRRLFVCPGLSKSALAIATETGVRA